MKLNYLLSSLFLFAAISTPPSQITAEPFSIGKSEPTHILVNNRILANVNGTAISVVDLMKKMDMLFYREFAEYATIPAARYQFYQANWKHMLSELIDKELILADAEEAKVPMSAGDVRQEMERLFGPNIIGNLDKIGMTFDEAQKIVHGDLLIQRVLFVRVNAKALRSVTPLDVRNYYDEYAKSHINPSEWTYQVITFRNKDSTAGAEAANIAYQYIAEENVSLTDLAEKIKKQNGAIADTQITISEEFKHAEKDLSPVYKENLIQLKDGDYSKPISQKSRADKSNLFRIFYLKEHSAGGPPAFADVESTLKEELLHNKIVEESKAYLKKLHKHFDVQESVPADFQPFKLK